MTALLTPLSCLAGARSMELQDSALPSLRQLRSRHGVETLSETVTLPETSKLCLTWPQFGQAWVHPGHMWTSCTPTPVAGLSLRSPFCSGLAKASPSSSAFPEAPHGAPGDPSRSPVPGPPLSLRLRQPERPQATRHRKHRRRGAPRLGKAAPGVCGASMLVPLPLPVCCAGPGGPVARVWGQKRGRRRWS